MTGGRNAEVCVDVVGFEPDRSLVERAKAVLNLEKGSPQIIETCIEQLVSRRHRIGGGSIRHVV